MRIAVLASGSGTILQSMVGAGISIDLVVVDRPCTATARAEAAAIPFVEVRRRSFGADFDRHAYTRALTQTLVEHNIDLVAMAGFGTIIGPSIYETFAGRILNTHPALLPSFPGWHAVDDALAAGVKVTGCTLHVATAKVDSGPIIAQRAVTVDHSDTVETLHERIKVAERDMYVESLGIIVAQGFVLHPGDLTVSQSTTSQTATSQTATLQTFNCGQD